MREPSACRPWIGLAARARKGRGKGVNLNSLIHTKLVGSVGSLV